LHFACGKQRLGKKVCRDRSRDSEKEVQSAVVSAGSVLSMALTALAEKIAM
jgi:hypothetical protein